MAAIPVVIYGSKSTVDEKDSTASQVAAARVQVEREGDRTEFAEPFTEQNVSGYQRSRGAQLEAAMKAAERAAQEHGEAELWVFHSSRLGRGSGLQGQARSLLEIFADLRRVGVALRSVEDDAFVTNQMLVGIAAEQAFKYSADLASHVKRGKKAQFGRGERLGGPVPDGYALRVVRDDQDRVVKRVYEIDAEREPVMRRLFALALDGHGTPAVARLLNTEGYRTKAGKPWTRRRVQDTVKSPFYAGLASQKGEKTGPNEYKRFSQPRVTPGDWPGYITVEEWERIAAATTKRDQAASGRKPEGQRTTRYALARLAVCDRCEARLYAVTSPYKRKDGTQQRSYVCANAKDATGLCDQRKLDAVKIDAAVVEHLNRLFVDFEAWLAELARGQEQQRTAVDQELVGKLDALDKVNKREGKLREKYFAALDADDSTESAAYELYQHVLVERESLQGAVRDLQEAQAAEPDQPPVDTMLDVYNDLARAVRTGSGEGTGDLNDRLRTVFAEFRLDEVEPGVVGVVPVLKPDVIERYGDALPVMIGPDGIKPPPANLPPTVPLVLWATDPDPPSEPPAARSEAAAGELVARGLHRQE